MHTEPNPSDHRSLRHVRSAHAFFALLALLFFTPSPAFAFDYEAHCRISNRAFRLAVNQIESRIRAAEERHRLLTLVSATWTSACIESRRSETLAYGEWVAQVDWALTPGDFFLTAVPGDTATRADRAPTAAIHRLVRTPLQGLRLLHNNPEHFGSTALYFSRVWHRYAIEEARAGNLEAALIYNAFADHYLQDLFAPGHIFTPRRGLNDVQTGATHNAYNVRGAFYYPENTHLLARYARGVVSEGDTALLSLAREACDDTDIETCIRGFSGDSIPMFGDYQLTRSPRQEFFVTLVFARSIEDILATWADRHTRGAVDNFQNARWCGYTMSDGSGSRRPWTSPTAEIQFGRFRQEEGAGLPLNERWRTYNVSYAIPTRSGRGYVDISTEALHAAWPGEWTGSGRRFLSNDVATHNGIDVRIPLDDVERTSVGYYRRWSSSINQIDARISRTLGLRVRPRDQIVEPNIAGGIELGYGLAYFELRPALAWNVSDGFVFTFGAGLRATMPRQTTKVTRSAAIPATHPAARTCETNTILIP